MTLIPSFSDEFDFPSAKLPDAAPLRESFANGQIESELKSIFGDLFAQVSRDTFDASVLGTPHLGSFELVRRTVNHDGLVLLQGDREEAATRYLYRAWKSGDIQKRGLHFLRTYLQLLFPGASEVKQLWHDKRFPYGDAFLVNEPRDPFFFNFLGQSGLSLDGSWAVGELVSREDGEQPEYKPDVSQMFLTSRVEILLGLEAIAASANSLAGDSRPATSGLLEVIRAVVPARLVPTFKFWLHFVLYVESRLSRQFSMTKESALRYPWCGRVISDNPDSRWSLGLDGQQVSLPQPFGTFRLGERRGGITRWRLRSCRAHGVFESVSAASIEAYRKPSLGERGRRLDGTWGLSRRQSDAFGFAGLDKQIEVTQEQKLLTTFHHEVRLDYPFTPRRLGSARVLDGRWRLRKGAKLKAAWAGQKLDGWKIGRKPSITAEHSLCASLEGAASASPSRLPPNPSPSRLARWNRRLDGAWALGALSRFGLFSLDGGTQLRARKMTQANALGAFSLGSNELAGTSVAPASPVTRRRPLNGWKLGAMESPEFSIAIVKRKG